MSQRPRITAENYEAVYDYFATPRLRPRVYNTLAALSRYVYQPETHVNEIARQQILEQISAGKGALIAGNHPSHHDPFVDFAAITQLDIPGLTSFTAYVKDSLFRGPTRPAFEYTGCLPVFRSKSYPDVPRQTLAAAAKRLHEITADRLINGHHVAMLPEGTNSKPDEYRTLRLESIKRGVGHLAYMASDSHSFIVPMGTYYRTPTPRQKRPSRHAIVTFGEPILAYGTTAEEIRVQIHEALQAALTASVAAAETT